MNPSEDFKLGGLFGGQGREGHWRLHRVVMEALLRKPQLLSMRKSQVFIERENIPRYTAALTFGGVMVATKQRFGMPYRLVAVEWVDSTRLGSEWTDLDAVGEPYPHKCLSVGFLVRKNKAGVMLVPNIGDLDHPDNRHTYGGMMIPLSAIIKLTQLK